MIIPDNEDMEFNNLETIVAALMNYGYSEDEAYTIFADAYAEQRRLDTIRDAFHGVYSFSTLISEMFSEEPEPDQIQEEEQLLH